MVRLGPRNFACYASVITLILTLYVFIMIQPLYAMSDGRLCPARTIGISLVLSVLTGCAAYGVAHGMLKCCPA